MSHPRSDGGFTLIELLVTISLLGAMMAIAVSGWSSWARASEHSGTARELQSVMRQAQQRAVTEGRPMCVELTSGQQSKYRVTRGSCAATTAVVAEGTLPARVHLSAPSFTRPGLPPVSGQTNVQFTSRGTGWPGSVNVVRDGSTTTYTLQVEVLTGHVSITQS